MNKLMRILDSILRGTLTKASPISNSRPFNVSMIHLALFVILIFIVAPGGRAGFATLTTWGDQAALLRTLKEWDTTGLAPLMSSNWMGPGFAAINLLFFKLLGSFEVSLILLSLFSFILIYVILVHEGMKNTSGWMKLQNIILIVASIFLIRINQLRDIPWTHFVTGALIFIIIYMFYYAKRKPLLCLPIGFLLFLSWQIRNFETLAVLASVLIFCLLRFILLKEWRMDFQAYIKRIHVHLGALTLGVFFAWVVIGMTTGQFKVFVQYQGAVPSLDLSIERLFQRITQIFLAPTWNTLASETLTPKTNFLENMASISFDIWYSPLMHSAPLLLPLLIAGVFLLFSEIIQLKRNQIGEANDHARIIILNLTAILITFGYLTQPIVGSTHLKYGILREFVLPQLLILLSFFLRWNYSTLEPKSRDIRFRRFNPSIFLLAAVVSMAIQPPKLQPFESMSVQPVDNECMITSELCKIEIRVLKANQWEKLSPQPVEYRTLCDGETRSYYSNSFTLNLSNCKNAQTEVFAIPLLFGLSSTPEANTIFEKFKEKWFKVPGDEN